MNEDTKQACPLCGSSSQYVFTGTDLLYKKDEPYDYRRCMACDALYQDPIPDKKDIASFYPETYYAYKPPSKKPRSNVEKAVLRYRYGYSHLDVPTRYKVLARLIPRARFRDAIPYIENGRVLDIGCGAGRYLSRLNQFGWHCEGVEMTKAAVDAAHKAGLSVFHGSLEEANFDDESFDIVHASHLIEHVVDPKSFMNEVSRILKPGGSCIVRTPNSHAFGLNIFKEKWYANEVPRHLIMYTPSNLKRLCENSGLTMVKMYLNTNVKLALDSWDYVIGNRGKPSQKKKLYKLLAQPYVWLAKLMNKGDEIYAVFTKPNSIH